MAQRQQQQQQYQRVSGSGNRNDRSDRSDRSDQKQQQQQQAFVEPSLCIPRTHANIRRERVFAVFRTLNLGWIGRIDVIPKKDANGNDFVRVFIHFTKWFNNSQTREFLAQLDDSTSPVHVVYDEPWYWKVTKSFVSAPAERQERQQPQQHSRFPMPRIEFGAPKSRTRVDEGSCGGMTPHASETVTVASSGGRVSGKGKQVAKNMGYESGKGLGKKADGRIVPVQIKKNIGKNGVGFGATAATAAAAAATADAAAAAMIDAVVTQYWSNQAEKVAIKEVDAVQYQAQAQQMRLSVSISPPPKLERKLFADDDEDDCVASAAKLSHST